MDNKRAFITSEKFNLLKTYPMIIRTIEMKNENTGKLIPNPAL
jgi:hypothetical protein